MRFFDKLFGGQEQESIIAPPDLSTKSKNVLEQLGFILTESSDRGMCPLSFILAEEYVLIDISYQVH